MKILRNIIIALMIFATFLFVILFTILYMLFPGTKERWMKGKTKFEIESELRERITNCHTLSDNPDNTQCMVPIVGYLGTSDAYYITFDEDDVAIDIYVAPLLGG